MYGDDSVSHIAQGSDSSFWQAIIDKGILELGVNPQSLDGFLDTHAKINEMNHNVQSR